ncbi:MAG: helix-turn-helix transcriptional regulator [Kangiellaceae bacterium]|nr:helix-turn-helix transcriptional regulator [Kangiellaceae bacterium]
MSNANQYGQYCPLALASQFVGSRWTMLIIRELLFGSSSFNDISQGVPRMSRTLLSNRLKEMIHNGLLTKSGDSTSRSHYQLTEAGNALTPIITDIAKWGQEWLKTEPLVEDIDVNLLMWDIRRNAVPLSTLPEKFIVEFYLNDAPENESSHWLIYENGEVELCNSERNYHVNVYIDVSVKQLTNVWMGWDEFDAAVNNRTLILKGNKEYLANAEKWLGKSGLADVNRQSSENRI